MTPNEIRRSINGGIFLAFIVGGILGALIMWSVK